MPPQSSDIAVADEAQSQVQCTKDPIELYGFDPYKYRWLWRRVIMQFLYHPGFFIGAYHMFTGGVHWQTTVWMLTCLYWSLFSVTAGAHRLWAHRAYKAKAPVRYAFALLFSMANQQDIFKWVMDHRIHHKHTDTDRDPHNSRRGFFFCHSGWLFSYPHPEVLKEYAKADLSDLEKDSAAVFQRKYHPFLAVSLCYFVPMIVPYYLWDEDLLLSFCLCCLFRYGMGLHMTSCINSFAHYFGSKPYDKTLTSTNWLPSNLLILCLGEGWHNYHHVFPFDYRANEVPYWANTTTITLDILAWMGLVYDRKVVSQESIDARKAKNDALHID